MLKKYLQFLIESFEKLTSLGGSNSTWNDYFLTVGNEFLVILIGLAYIVAIFLIVYIPIFGNKKLIRRIRKNDKWYKFYSLYEKYTEAVLKIRSIVSNIEQTGGFCPNTSNEDNTMKNIERSTEKAIKAWNRRASN